MPISYGLFFEECLSIQLYETQIVLHTVFSTTLVGKIKTIPQVFRLYLDCATNNMGTDF